MKLELPLTPRYLWPIAVGLLALDLVMVAGVSLVLYNAADRARVFVVDGMKCRTYAPPFGQSIYLVARCTKEKQ